MTNVREFDAAYHLDNPIVIAAYLTEAFETGNNAFIAQAIRTVIRASVKSKFGDRQASPEKVGYGHDAFGPLQERR